MPKIEISDEAADCLAFWVGHSMYGDTISEVIVDQMREWCNREHKSYEPGEFNGMFNELPPEALR